MLTRGRRKSVGLLSTDDHHHQDTFALLGFNSTSSSDVLRISYLKALYSKARIITCSEQVGGDHEDHHLCCDFKHTLFHAMDVDTCVMMLDYFWLQSKEGKGLIGE